MTSTPVERHFIGRDERRVRLEDHLAQRWPDIDRKFWRRACREQTVTVNGEPAHPQQRLSQGDVVELGFDAAEAPSRRSAPAAEDLDAGALDIRFEDERVIVVDKPAGMHTVPDRGGKYAGVHGRLDELRPGDDLRIVHRLDAGTSGCLMLAKGLEMARAFDAAFRSGVVHKEYLALVAGAVRRHRELDGPLGPDRRRPGRVKVVAPGSKGAREALTIVEVEEAFRQHTLVRALPRTGRSHQIRAHLRWAGHPILGDPDYGPAKQLLLSDLKSGFKLRAGVTERPLLRRMFLHAEVLEVPAAGGVSEPVRVTAPLPADLAMVVDKLRRFSAPREA